MKGIERYTKFLTKGGLKHMDKTLIAPSTDPAKTLDDLLLYVKHIQEFADLLHCDVMDGEFVERKTISYDTIAHLKDNC